MNILINRKKYSLSEPTNDGGEGEIYVIDFEGIEKCVKIYYPDKRTPYAERKVIALINKFGSMNFGDTSDYIAFPEIPVYEEGTNEFCGFLMKYFGSHHRLIDLFYSKNNGAYAIEEFTDEDAINIIDALYFKLKVLHRLGLIVGDLNPENILIDKTTREPVLVDIDSFQVGTYYSNSRRKEYVDPKVRIDGYGKAKYFIFSTESDIFSLAIVAYEFLIGSKPYFFNTLKPSDSIYKKNINLSFLDYYIENRLKNKISEFPLYKDPLYYATIVRLYYLETNHFPVFTFLKSVFCDGKRYYFYYKEKKEVVIRRKNGQINIQEIELIKQSKEDPEELQLFLNQYQITIP